jgi:hypothetical protein
MYESGPAVMEVNKLKNELEKIKNNALESRNQNYYSYNNSNGYVPHPLTHVSRNQEKNTAAPLRISRTFVTLIAIIIPKSMIFDGRSGLYLKLNLIS